MKSRSFYILFLILALFTSSLIAQNNSWIDNWSDLNVSMKNGDTATIAVRLRICILKRYEISTLIKRNDTVWIETLIEEPDLEIYDTIGPTVLADSIRFSNLFYSIMEKTMIDSVGQNEFIRLKINNDKKIIYYSEGLAKMDYQIGKYKSMFNKIYPDEDYYKPLEIVEDTVEIELPIRKEYEDSLILIEEK